MTAALVTVPKRRPVWIVPVGAVLVVFGLPSFVAGHLSSGQQAMQLVQQVLSAPLAYSIPALLPVAKLLLVAMPGLVIAGVRRSPQVLVGYYAVALVVVGLLQNAAQLPAGLAFLTGNAIAQLGLAVLCVVAFRSVSVEAGTLRTGRLWVAPLMLLAVAFPYAAQSGHVVPSLDGALTGGAGMTFCMITAVVAGTMFVRPDGFPGWLRFAVGSTGILYGLLNLLTWFVLTPASWWMGVLHVPLFTCSTALAVTSWRDARRRSAPAGR